MFRLPVQIPKMSVAVSEATFVQPLVDEGQQVNEGDPLYLIETEKVETEIVAPVTGVVHWTAEVGETYNVGTEIGFIEADD